MILILSNWERFCKKLQQNGFSSLSAGDLYLHPKLRDKCFLVLKHDVETNVKRAYAIAKIEHTFGHKGSFYVQAYLLKNKRNIEILRKIQEMGHEVSYHHDVMDSTKGNLELAIMEFRNNLNIFEKNEFQVITVCQHGNPLIDRVGYSSNRDFFRSERIQKLFPGVFDIMVNFKKEVDLEYLYFSDAGRQLQLVFDPINNDILKSDDKNVEVKSFEKLYDYIAKSNCIISIHPHRWETNVFSLGIKIIIFKSIRNIAQVLFHFPFFKKLSNKYYYLAKKI